MQGSQMLSSNSTSSHAGQSVSGSATLRIVTYDDVAAIPAPLARELWAEFGSEMRKMLLEMGGPVFDWEDHCDNFFEKLNTFVPPIGRYYLAFDNDGALVGHAAMRRVEPGIAEFKHMYVRPAARGLGLGRDLTVRRMQDARALGFDTFTLDTFTVNRATRRLYESLGFEQVQTFAASGTLAVSPWIGKYGVFYRKCEPG